MIMIKIDFKEKYLKNGNVEIKKIYKWMIMYNHSRSKNGLSGIKVEVIYKI